MPKPINFVKFTSADLNYIGDFYFGEKVSIGIKNKEYYKGKVVVLVNEFTQSSSEYIAMGLKAHPKFCCDWFNYSRCRWKCFRYYSSKECNNFYVWNWCILS